MTKKTSTASKAQHIPTLERLSSLKLKTDIPAFSSGDKLVIRSKIKEGEKERIQAFEGIVIAKNGRGIQETMTVRKISAGVGVERVYPVHSPAIVSIEVKTQGFVRRSKLYYLRKLQGKASRIRDKNLRLLESQGTPNAEATAKTAAPASEA